MIKGGIFIVLLLCLFLLLLFTGLDEPEPQPNLYHSSFPHRVILDANGDFQLSWKSDDETITFQYSATTKGWAGLGFSPNGGMKGSDIVLFWTDANGSGQISDRHGDKNGFPPEDEKQDYTLLETSQNQTHLVVIFSRKKDTCDPQDWVLSDDTTRIIYAANDAIPVNKDNFRIHAVRGAKSVHLFNRKIGGRSDDGDASKLGAKPYDFKVTNVRVPANERTAYWCEIFKLPTFGKKTHVIKFEPIIEQRNANIVHHMVIFACSKDMHEYVGKGHFCFWKDEGETTAKHLSNCRFQPITVWTDGGEAYLYPDDIGYPLYDDGSDTYFLIEIHYDNPKLKQGVVDSSGIRFWITDQLRSIDTGQIVLGTAAADETAIPPRVDNFTVYGYCSSECTQVFPADGVKVIGGLLHMHLAGRKIRVSHIRNGKELPPILFDNNYDFNFQVVHHLKEPVTLLPGDIIFVECVYETLDRANATFSGPKTYEEMCLVFLNYYPAVYRGVTCLGSPDQKKLYETLATDAVHQQSETYPSHTGVADGDLKSLSRYLKENFNFNWTTEKIAAYQKEVRDGTHSVMCVRLAIDKRLSNENFHMFEQVGYPRITEPFVVPADPCRKIEPKQLEIADDYRETNERRNRTNQTARVPVVALQTTGNGGKGGNNAGESIRGQLAIIVFGYIAALTASFVR